MGVWRLFRLTGLVFLVAMLLTVAGQSGASSGSTTRVSVDSAGNQGNNFTQAAAISVDGRYVTFWSDASNLVAGDTNGYADIFVHDRQTGATERVSVDSGGNQGNDDSAWPAISADGRYIAFQSYATNLVAGDTNGYGDIFVHDRQTGATERVSVDSGGNQANNVSVQSAISADGLYVVFDSMASNLILSDTNHARDIFVHDRQTALTERVSVDSAGNEANAYSGGWGAPAISADGRYVGFESGASNLVSSDTNNVWDIFVHDRQTGTTERVSVDSTGNEGDAHSGLTGGLTLSADGRYVAFESEATNLVAGDTNGYPDIFVHDRQTGATERVSVDSGGNQGNNISRLAAISSDGCHVVFESRASNLVVGDTNGASDVFVHDRDTDADGVFDEAGAIATARVSVDSAGNQGNSDSYWPGISGEGRWVAFESWATNLVPGDTNGQKDVFVRDREAIAVGGIAELPEAPEGRSSSATYPALAGGLAAALLALTAGAWYARRRWLRRA